MKANVSEARNKIKLNKLGKSMDPRLGCLRILFKEILQQIPPRLKHARKMTPRTKQ